MAKWLEPGGGLHENLEFSTLHTKLINGRMWLIVICAPLNLSVGDIGAKTQFEILRWGTLLCQCTI